MSVSEREPVNILLVDDQPAKLLSYEAILGNLGETLIKAASAREALAYLLKLEVAVVLIDVEMPELDGFELAAMIRAHPRFRRTALIFVSAIHLSDLDRIKGYEAGAVDYVPVPVIPEVLRAKVQVFADLHRKTRELKRLNDELEERVAERTAALEASRSELQRLNEELEHRVNERTREREQALAQLFEAQKVDTVGRLTDGIAHDFNNLLMAMISSLEVLKKRLKDDPRASGLIETALRGAARGSALTQRLLAFARRQELRPESVQAAELVTGMQDLLARALGPAVKIQVDVPADLPPILVDANQLELALLNLVVNARDAMPEGGIITLSATEADPGDAGAPEGLAAGRYVRLTVADTGTGMPESVLTRATEPFFTTKGIGKGTGLGLSMVHGLAGQSGGALKLSSVIGEGTNAELWLPQSEQAARARERKENAGKPEVAPAHPLTVLLVDDDSLVLAGWAAALDDLGHTAVEANSGAEALALLKSHPEISLVVTDYAMPGMTGLALAEQIARAHPGLPIALATGFAELPAGSTDLPRIRKPFQQAELAEMIASLSRNCRPGTGAS